MSRRYGHVRPKKNAIYTANEVQSLYDVCRNTVSNWVQSGLRPVDAREPQLFRGSELSRYHQDRVAARKRLLRVAEFNCVSCKLRVVPDTTTIRPFFNARARAIECVCPDCGRRLVKFLTQASYDAILQCVASNTSLHTPHEEEGLAHAAIGKDRGEAPVAWNGENERILREYQDYCGRDAATTLDARFASIRDFEAFVELKSLRKVTTTDVARYREALSERGRDGGSRSAIAHRASHLRMFFAWLVKQEGYRQMNHSIADYFVLSRRDMAKAVPTAAPEYLAIEDFVRMVAAMPSTSLINRRDRAIIAFTCLVGTRASATASLRLGAVDIPGRRVVQDGRWVRVKNSKSQVTIWFPVPELFSATVIEWVTELRKLGCRDDDALFPPNEVLEVPRLLSHTDRGPITPWATDDGVRRAFALGATALGVAYINPHSVRHTLVALGTIVCRSIPEELAWSHNLGHSKLETTRSHYARMTDAHRDQLVAAMATRDPLPEEDKDLLIAYHQKLLMPGSPEFQRAEQLDDEMRKRRKLAAQG